MVVSLRICEYTMLVLLHSYFFGAYFSRHVDSSRHFTGQLAIFVLHVGNRVGMIIFHLDGGNGMNEH